MATRTRAKATASEFGRVCDEARELSRTRPQHLTVVREVRRLAERQVLSYDVCFDAAAFEVMGGYAYGARAAYRGGEDALGDLFPRK